MRQIIIITGLVFSIFTLKAQEIKHLKPTNIQPLDFSEKAHADWALRDSIFSELSLDIAMEDLTEEELAIIKRYDESYESLWDANGGGCSWYCGGGPHSITASSYLKALNENSYQPENAHDLNFKHAWIEGAKNYGIGEYLTYHFSAGSPRITKIIVANGYVKDRTIWENNSRVKKLKMYINDSAYAILHLMDKIATQEFKVEPIGYRSNQSNKTKRTKDWTLKFEILEVYKGLKYKDVAISELYFDGIDVHCFAKGTTILMADKSIKNIEDLKVGELITTFDIKKGETKSVKIEQLEKVFHNSLVTYNFESGLKITATQDHPFLVKDKNWASLKPEKSKIYKGFEIAGQIEIGDLFQTLAGIEKLKSIEHLETTQETYTISKLNSGNTFIANGLIVLVEELRD